MAISKELFLEERRQEIASLVNRRGRASVTELSRRLGVSAKDYLLDVLPGLDYRTLSQVAALTPARWSAARG